MEDFKINKLSEEEKKALEEKSNANRAWGWLIGICVFICLFAVIVFFIWNHPVFYFHESLDHNVFGTFGDFVGGILGTMVAVFSVYFLVRTLHSQIDSNTENAKSNRSVIDSNEKLLELNNLQLFDNQFQTLNSQYLNAVNSYKEGADSGRIVLESKVKEFLSSEFENDLEFKRRAKAAVSKFEDFYAENRTEFSVHFRVLYLLVKLIAEANIEDEDRVVYAKCIRGQLSEGELAILRYNCMTNNGKKMQPLVNHFNLLKHLPLMTLFEFRKWKNSIEKEELLSALDSLFITIKKGITNLNYNSKECSAYIEVSTRYKISYSFNGEHNNFSFNIEKKKEHKNGGGVKRPLAEKAMDCLGEEQLTELFEAFLFESFVTGSFGLYNGDECKIGPDKVIKNSDEEYVVNIPVEKTKKIVLAERQMEPGT